MNHCPPFGRRLRSALSQLGVEAQSEFPQRDRSVTLGNHEPVAVLCGDGDATPAGGKGTRHGTRGTVGARSFSPGRRSSEVEHILGRDGVKCSIPLRRPCPTRDAIPS